MYVPLSTLINAQVHDCAKAYMLINILCVINCLFIDKVRFYILLYVL